jgi:hypothetical protein
MNLQVTGSLAQPKVPCFQSRVPSTSRWRPASRAIWGVATGCCLRVPSGFMRAILISWAIVVKVEVDEVGGVVGRVEVSKSDWALV